MCAGPVKNLIEDATGATARRDAEQNAAKFAAEKQRQMDLAKIAEEAEAKRLEDIEAKRQEIIDNAAAERANIETTLGDELSNVKQANDDLIDTLISNASPNSGGGAPAVSNVNELAANSAARTSQSVLNREKKKKKKGALKIPYSPSKRQEGNRGPRSTKADLQIEGQTQATGTGTNLAI